MAVLECQVSKMVNSHACPRPTTGVPPDWDNVQLHARGAGRAGLLLPAPHLMELEREPALLKLVHQHVLDPHRRRSGAQDCDKILVEFILNIY